jgi:tripartite-type tricarboxylate transporter receptor subunit TctC
MFGASGAVHAQPYPNKPVRIIVAHAPGGPVDVLARLVQPKVQEVLGQQLVVENRVGAGGNIGTAAVAKSPPDGYTVLANSSAFAVNPSLTPNAGYDPDRDFAPVVQVATQPNLIVVHPSVNAKNLQELLALAKTAKLSYASPGSGTTPHLTAEMLFRVIGKVEVTGIHYKGAGPAAAAVVAGEPSVGSLAVTAPIPHVRAGKLRAVAISSAKRNPALPDVATFAEQGFPNVQDYTWVGFFAPAGTPAAAVQRLNDAVNQAIKSPEVLERLASLAFEPIGGTPEQFAQYVKEEVVKWGKVVKETGARVD